MLGADHSMLVRWVMFLILSGVGYVVFRVGASIILRALKSLSEEPEAVTSVAIQVHALIITGTLQVSLNLVREPTELVLLNEFSKTLLFLAMAWLGVKIISALIFTTYVNRMREARVPELIEKVITGCLYAASGLVILHYYFGVDVAPVLVAGAVIAIVGGIAFQDSLRDFFAGISLNLDDTYRVGDMVKVAGYTGEVVDTGSRTTKIRSAYNDYVTLPNKAIANAPIINFHSPEALHRSVVKVPVSASAPPGEVCRILAGSARLARGVLWDNRAIARLCEIQGETATYSIEYWIDHYADNARVEDRILQLCWYRLRRYGFAISGQTLPAEVSGERLEQEEALLLVEGMLLFNTLEIDEQHFLAEQGRIENRKQGEVLFTRGSTDDSFYLITRGVVHLAIEVQRDGESEICMEGMGPGWSFGELSLLTGEPWPFDAVAGTDCELFVLDKTMFQLLLERKPGLAQRMSEQVSAVKNRERNAFRHLEAIEPVAPPSEENVLSRISEFFDLG